MYPSNGYTETRHCAARPEALSAPADPGSELSVTRLGNRGAPATVAYVPGPLADSTLFTTLILELQHVLGTDIAHLVYDRGNLTNSLSRLPRAAMAQRVDDLDLALEHASGRVVLVVHSLAAIVMQEWLYRHRHDHPPVDAIVAISPILELPDVAGAFTEHPTVAAQRASFEFVRALGGPARPEPPLAGRTGSARQLLRAYRRCGADAAVVEELLRATPTWIVAGRADAVVSWQRAEELASTVWAELTVVESAGHDLLHTHPHGAIDAILAALEAARNASIFGGDL